MKYGEVDDLFIYHHPFTNKHLGLARVMFTSVKSAKECVERLNKTSVMGKIIKVFLDAFGKELNNFVKFLTDSFTSAPCKFLIIELRGYVEFACKINSVILPTFFQILDLSKSCIKLLSPTYSTRIMPEFHVVLQ